MFKQIPPIGLFVLWLLILTGTIFFSDWVLIKSQESSIKPSLENLTTTNATIKQKARVKSEKVVPEDIVKYIFVKKGDTLWDIAQKHKGVSVWKIKSLNNLETDKLMPGTKILLPKG